MISPEPHDHWYRRGTLYQIYPLSWADSNGDGFGDLPGILQHLDYLYDGTANSLGVTAVWLSPIYRSPMADWGYDVADHCAVDPRFGSMADFDRLLAEMHRRGMKLLLDFVPNHTSVEHEWFRESQASRQSAKRDWYIWADPAADGGPPNNWLSKFGGSAWSLDEATGQYYLHTFLAQEPDLNWRNPAVRQAMLAVLRFWLARGVDGFRTDAVTSLLKDPQLRDDPPNPDYRPSISDPADANLRIYSSGRPGMEQLLGSLCEVVSPRNEERVLLSEIYVSLPHLQEFYAPCRRHPMHAPFNFNLLALEWSAAAFRSFIDEYEAALAPEDWPNYVLGNHDRPRLASRLGPDRARLLIFLQLTLRGLPVVYYGDELGLESSVMDTTKSYDQPAQRWPAAVFDRDAARAPMPWQQRGPRFGFSTAQPWLPASLDSLEHNVATEEAQPDSLLQMCRRLIHLRASGEALAEGDYRSIESNNPDIFAYVRETTTMRCYVFLNFTGTKQTVILGRIGAWTAGTHLIEGDGVSHEGGPIELEAYEGRLYELRRGR
ncbi:MAG TPA: alpha-amylase family glycosyl hydrolase [Candidatus Saccharimonadia bacterium]|nr:alpha-amylase family glycosyl hydrolase [Candidatus Saccharimonadia bacterium]